MVCNQNPGEGEKEINDLEFSYAYLKREGGTVIIAVAGELDCFTSGMLKGALKALVEADIVNFILDLENLTYCDSEGLKVILGCYKAIQEHGGKMPIVILKASHVYRSFEISGFTSALDIFEREEEAAAMLAGGSTVIEAPGS